ncbi:FecCD family ABC transporter permease [Photobacterium chitinilyticum]|uniref:Iron ABC transporter permease n=1 Tax=Photobacterium chitinilyticum TaxID=2485123 RepID=A0A3S3UMY9_9GAMM|nr:iron chelate uptake ABC transporter family permease subunit [Photobacterium chitinilyticum]RWX56199.1 iron ABC transporter permease [Photobacterium chitinilyticum]
MQVIARLPQTKASLISLWTVTGLVLSLFLSLVLSLVLSLIAWSTFGLSIDDVYQVLVAFDPDSMSQQLIITLRLPRTLVALLIGANLAVAGVLMQGITRNALASPAILGINAGAACCMALASVGVGFLSILPPVLTAAIGGTMGGMLVFLLGGFFSGRIHPLRLVLAGIAVNALLTGLTRAAVIISDELAYSVLHWLAGSVAEAGWEQWQLIWPVSMVGLMLALSLAGKLNILSLGEDMACGLGINITRVRMLACIAVVLLTSVSVSIAGPIAFVGLLIPHISRKLVGHEHRRLIPIAALLGASLLVWSDLLARGVAFPAETPVGIITALIGTPCFILLAMRSKLS